MAINEALTDKTDIVWRLRANWSYLGREAADEITRLRAEVERLRITEDERQAMQDGICLCEGEAGEANENANAHAWARAAGSLRGLLDRHCTTSTS